MRGGYWAQAKSRLGILSFRWVRCKECQPTPDSRWIFYPWGQKTIGNGYIDEWYPAEPCWAIPFSAWVVETIGTNDMACMVRLIEESRKANEFLQSEGLSLALEPFKSVNENTRKETWTRMKKWKN